MLNLDWHFFPVFDRLDPATAYPGTYNLGLVATSVAIAILAVIRRSFNFRAHRRRHDAARPLRLDQRGRDQLGRRHLVNALRRHVGVFAALRDHL